VYEDNGYRSFSHSVDPAAGYRPDVMEGDNVNGLEQGIELDERRTDCVGRRNHRRR
jgi:hypothetical protein